VSETEKMDAIRKGLIMLPYSHLLVLEYFFGFLSRVAANCAVNEMPSKNLAIVIGPSLQRPQSSGGIEDNLEKIIELVDLLIRQAEQVQLLSVCQLKYIIPRRKGFLTGFLGCM
jgi:hypothetical protein